MKNINLITFVSLFIAPLVIFSSNFAMAQSPTLEVSMPTALIFEDDFLKEDDAFMVSFDQQNDKLTVNFEIASDYYLYRDKFKFESNQLTLSPIELPAGTTHKDEYFGIQQIYKTHLSFTLNIQKATPGATIDVKYQGCAAKGLCYQPITKTVTIKQINVKEKID